MTRARPITSLPRSLGQRAVLLAALLAFVLQNFALQTHVHHAAPAYSHAVHVESTPRPLPFNGDGSGDESSCRLCQEFAHSGAALTAVTFDLLAVLAFAWIPLDPDERWIAIPAICFNWQSRAPPLR